MIIFRQYRKSGMGNFITVFSITDNQHVYSIPITLIIAVVLSIVWVCSAILVIARQFTISMKVKRKRSLIYFAIPIIVLAALSPIEKRMSDKSFTRMIEKNKKSTHNEIEGYVRVIFTRPEKGHTGGDIIQIKKVTFKIHNTFPFYDKTINEGGVLRTNNHVRVYYYLSANSDDYATYGDGKIFRIDVMSR